MLSERPPANDGKQRAAPRCLVDESTVRSRRRRHAGNVLALLVLGLTGATASAQTTPIFQENFQAGLGQFTPTGNAAAAPGIGAARVSGAFFGAGGTLTSTPISTVGVTGLTLSFDRLTSGLDAGEAGVAAISINGGAFTTVESLQTATGRATITLPANAANQSSVVLRFSVIANSPFETYTVDNIVLAGVRGGNQPGNGNRPAIGDFITFESGQVRPLALSSNGQRLYAVNTPDSRVEVFDTSTGTPRLLESIVVGLEPVAVALASDTQLWVVNHLSDSISIVDVSTSPARVVNTLLVGDEPRDIVFAGTNNRLAFITAAHRGQNAPFDPQLTTEGIGRADVWVFDSTNLGTAMGGTPLTILNMFGDTMRGLARNADGTRVYAAVFNSGNRTTIAASDITMGGIQKAPPFTSADGAMQPQTGLIVQFNGTNWVDNGDPKTNTPRRTFDNRVKLSLPDFDVFTIDASGSTPTVASRVSGVGTTLFNVAVNPRSGNVYVSNQEALNLTRFEGPGRVSTTVRGHFAESRITVINGNTVTPRHLNKHITSYNSDVGTDAERALSVAIPLQMAVTGDGNTLFLAAMGANKLTRYSTSQLESNSFTPNAADQLVLTGGLPTGLVLDEPRNRAFVLTRQDNGISVVNTQQLAETAHVTMFNPEPPVVVNGRKFLYDATISSSRGDSACAGCHIFGDIDLLAWDLGIPEDRVVANPNTYNPVIPVFLRRPNFHPMKGPMTTQSFRGLKGNGPMHWRGDRTGVARDTNETLEEQAFEDFNVAFPSLLGRAQLLTTAEMDAFTKFVLQLTYPPNPIANLDNSLTPIQQQGMQVYNSVVSDTLTTCNGCHRLNRPNGDFGSDSNMSFEGNEVAQDFKIPHLRNMYQKVGMFSINTVNTAVPNMGDQIKGFGYDQSGAVGTIDLFLSADVFNLSAAQRQQVEQFVLAYPSDMNPVVGQQVTVPPGAGSRTDISARVNLLVARASVTTPVRECEVVAKAVIQGRASGWVMNSSQQFVPDDSAAPTVSLQALLSQAAGAQAPLTFTCAPPGNGTRLGVDRDSDNILDRNDSN